MSDPVNVPEQVGSGHVLDQGPGAAKRAPAIGHRKIYPWGWVVGIVVLLLMLWGFFGMDHEKPVIQPVMEPVPAATMLP